MLSLSIGLHPCVTWEVWVPAPCHKVAQTILTVEPNAALKTILTQGSATYTVYKHIFALAKKWRVLLAVAARLPCPTQKNCVTSISKVCLLAPATTTTTTTSFSTCMHQSTVGLEEAATTGLDCLGNLLLRDSKGSSQFLDGGLGMFLVVAKMSNHPSGQRVHTLHRLPRGVLLCWLLLGLTLLPEPRRRRRRGAWCLWRMVLWDIDVPRQLIPGMMPPGSAIIPSLVPRWRRSWAA